MAPHALLMSQPDLPQAIQQGLAGPQPQQQQLKPVPMPFPACLDNASHCMLGPMGHLALLVPALVALCLPLLPRLVLILFTGHKELLTWLTKKLKRWPQRSVAV